MIHELKQVIWVTTEFGIGQALFLIDYGLHQNTIWVVALKDTREIKHFNSNQIKMSVNYTVE